MICFGNVGVKILINLSAERWKEPEIMSSGII